ncbi:hypothetical protein [Halorubrum sp. Ea8]|uniref:hypothetical protein n=1 Tax=Halorubrum sp. Ea8 TaxID=1383841 RepID=UPI0011404917|nr:hypothetical protein [Halorubrum sp. Ea8]
MFDREIGPSPVVSIRIHFSPDDEEKMSARNNDPTVGAADRARTPPVAIPSPVSTPVVRLFTENRGESLAL